MRLMVADVEVFRYDWLFVGKDRESGEYTIIHNDNAALKEVMSDEDTVFVFFNGKHYDQFIVKAICCGADNKQIKELNDYCIAGGHGWEHPLVRNEWFWFNVCDIRDDVQQGLSLKAIEGHLNLSIEESTVSFDIDRPLTQSEFEETVRYCIHDVDSTEKLVEIRKDYLKTKLNLGARANIPPTKALAATNAKLTAMMLGAVKQEWNDGRDYVYPPNLDVEIIPKPILDFFDTIHDKSIPDDVLFKTSLTIDLGGMKCKYAWGGVHGSLTCYHEESTDERVIQNRDVSSLYPSLIEEYNYLSRNVPDPQLFYDIRKDRIAAKHNGDNQTAKDLKLPLNTVSGAQENKYNDLYDPLPTRSLRISGQLFLTMLAIRLLEACKTIKLLNFNTDGLMYSIEKEELHLVDAISAQWEKDTRFELETDDIQKVWIKDVNNLILIQTNGKVKTVGGYLNYGVSVKGAWVINNNAIIVKKALVEYFTKGTSVEETINACDDIFQFQMIAKAGAKYREAYHLIDDVQHPVQKVNRVYATSDTRYGKLFKVKAETDQTAKIEMLPDHCIIDNDNHLTIADVDKSFYISMAHKRINDFLGIKPEKVKTERKKKMSTTTKSEAKAPETLNVFQKLLKARVMFLAAGVKKTGKNMKLSYKYYELDDIVPPATGIFNELGLLPLVSFTNEEATMKLINTDKPDEGILFTSPMRELEAITSSRTGGEVTNAIQRLGSVETYQRRYLYMAALDICESDAIDATGSSEDAPPATGKAPATTEKREEVKKSLTNKEGNASTLQIKQLKEALKRLRELDPEQEDFIAEIAVKTEGFTVITKVACEKLLISISDMIAEKEKED